MDADHAAAVREAAKALNEALRQAAADGLTVRLAITQETGFQRGRDKSTRFDGVKISEAHRPL